LRFHEKEKKETTTLFKTRNSVKLAWWTLPCYFS
jgi:hypothetical protein